MEKILIISKEWKLRSYLKAELLEYNLGSICLKDVGDLKDLNLEDFKVVLIDCKDQPLQNLQDALQNLKALPILIDADSEELKGIKLKRPLTIEDCLNLILKSIR